MRGHLLRLLHLASPALPIGAFHFSQGLEYAVEAGWVKDERTAHAWIAGCLRENVGTLDLPIVARIQRGWLSGDERAVRYWSQRALASRETEELRAEDRHMGQALARILRDLGVIAADSIDDSLSSYTALFARACAVWSVPEQDALQTYAWTWAENQTLAAVKLVPLGQTAGQRVLHALQPEIERVAERASLLRDDDVAVATVMQAFASARHESQYTRLFRS